MTTQDPTPGESASSEEAVSEQAVSEQAVSEQAVSEATSAPGPVPTPGPRPGPTPGARPGPRPGVRPAAAPVAAVAVPPAPASDPHRFGRVDDDGTVWLITAAGERTIGSWQAGDAEAAFTHFGRRYDDLSTEVALMEHRLESGTGDARKIRAAAATLAESLPEAHVLGDVDALAARLAAIGEHAEAAAVAERARRDEHRVEQTARKEALAAEAEDMAANSTQWKAAGDRLRTILDEWKAITGLDRKTDDALWKRYSAARETFNRRRGSHFSELDRERAGAKQAKEQLCVRAEALSGSTDWGPTSASFRDLLVEWKALGRAAKEVDDALWRRFKAAQDTFFSARNSVTAERDAEFQSNADAKEALLVEAERIDASDGAAARAALRSLTDKWDAIGKVPRERTDLEKRLRAVEKKVRDAAEEDRTDPEAQARAAQFRVRAEQFEKQAAKAEAAGRTKDAEQARASAAQWHQWAETASDAVTKKR